MTRLDYIVIPMHGLVSARLPGTKQLILTRSPQLPLIFSSLYHPVLFYARRDLLAQPHDLTFPFAAEYLSSLLLATRAGRLK